jgi:CBS domain-containing protein
MDDGRNSAAAAVAALGRLMRASDGAVPTKVGELSLWHEVVSLGATAGSVEKQFLDDAALPGFIVHASGQVVGILSRRTLLTAISQPFGREVFIKRPLHELVKKLDYKPLVLEANTTIAAALRLAMARREELRFEPCLVKSGDTVGLLEMHTLMLAHANLLEEAMTSKDNLITRIKAILGSY